MGVQPYHLLASRTANRVWPMDLTVFRLLWLRFTIVVLLDGFSRRLLALKVYAQTPSTDDMVTVVNHAADRFGRPRFVITDHGGQFLGRFEAAMQGLGIITVKGKVRCPSFNGKAERIFRTLRLWLRVTQLPWRADAIQRRLDDFAHWFNEHRAHRALGGRTPAEAWTGVELPEPVPIRATDWSDVRISVKKRSCRGDPHLPIVAIRVVRKEAT